MQNTTGCKQKDINYITGKQKGRQTYGMRQKWSDGVNSGLPEFLPPELRKGHLIPAQQLVGAEKV